MPVNNKKFASNQEEKVCKTLLDKFFAYYTHNNIYYENHEEFCDALVIFEDYNLVFQMKSVQNENINSYNRNLIDGIKQLNKNYEALRDTTNLNLYIGKGSHRKSFNQPLGKKTFYILVMDGMWNFIKDGLEGLCDKVPSDDSKKYRYLIGLEKPDNLPDDKLYSEYFIYNSREYFEKVLRCCSTIKDFVNFLEFTTEITKKKIFIPHDEALLHLFLLGDRQVLENDLDAIHIIDDSCNLQDERIVSILNSEEESRRIVDKNLIELFLYEQNKKDICQKSEPAIKEIAALTRQQRLSLTNLIIQVQLEDKYGAIFFNDERDTMYCIANYSNFRKASYNLDVKDYIPKILYPHLSYQAFKQKKLLGKTVLVVYERATNNLVLRTLVHVDTPADLEVIANGEEIDNIFKKIERDVATLK